MRCIALLVAACLVVDPVTASGLAAPFPSGFTSQESGFNIHGSGFRIDQAPFEEGALAAMAAFFAKGGQETLGFKEVFRAFCDWVHGKMGRRTNWVKLRPENGSKEVPELASAFSRGTHKPYARKITVLAALWTAVSIALWMLAAHHGVGGWEAVALHLALVASSLALGAAAAAAWYDLRLLGDLLRVWTVFGERGTTEWLDRENGNLLSPIRVLDKLKDSRRPFTADGEPPKLLSIPQIMALVRVAYEELNHKRHDELLAKFFGFFQAIGWLIRAVASCLKEKASASWSLTELRNYLEKQLVKLIQSTAVNVDSLLQQCDLNLPLHMTIPEAVEWAKVAGHDPTDLGGKMAGFVELKKAGVETQKVFWISPRAALRVREDWGGIMPLEILERETKAMGEGASLGDPKKPLLLVVRTDAKEPYPGLLPTVRFVGMTPEVYSGMRRLADAALTRELADIEAKNLSRDERRLEEAKAVGSRIARYAEIDNMYCQFLWSFGVYVLRIPDRHFASIYRQAESEQQTPVWLVHAFQELIEKRFGRTLPGSAQEQLIRSIEAVALSGGSPSVRNLKRLYGNGKDGLVPISIMISPMVETPRVQHLAGEAPSLQALPLKSGYGRVSTHDPRTREPRTSTDEDELGSKLVGTFDFRSLGQLLQWSAADRPIQELKDAEPSVFRMLCKMVAEIIKKTGESPREIRFIFEVSKEGPVEVMATQMQPQVFLPRVRLKRVVGAPPIEAAAEHLPPRGVPASAQLERSEIVDFQDVQELKRGGRVILGDPKKLKGRAMLHGRLVSTKLAVKRWSRKAPLFFVASPQNKDLLPDLLTRNKLSGVILAPGVAPDTGFEELMRLLQVPVLKITGEEAPHVEILGDGSIEWYGSDESGNPWRHIALQGRDWVAIDPENDLLVQAEPSEKTMKPSGPRANQNVSFSFIRWLWSHLLPRSCSVFLKRRLDASA
jgi:hypothetical protein